MKIFYLSLLMITVTVIAVTQPVQAQATPRDAGNTAKAAATAAAASAAQAQQALQAMTEERDLLKKGNEKLQTEVATLKAKLANAQGQVKGLQTDLGSTDTVVERYKQRDASWQERLDQQRAKMQEVIDKFKEVAQNLRSVEGERSELRVKLGAKEKELQGCVDNNIKLYKTGLELVEHYENKSIWDNLLQYEPVTRIKKVELETHVQDYMIRLKESNISSVEP